MNRESPRIRSLLRQAERNVEAGKYAAAEAVYRQIVGEMPESSAGWLGLAQVTKDVEEKEAAYKKVISLDQTNEQAIAGLNAMQNEVMDGSLTSDLNKQEDKQTSNVNNPAPSHDEVKDKSVYPDPAISYESDAVAPAKQVQEATIQDDDHDHVVVNDPDAELFCYRHPNRATSLRCYKCNNPICSECTVKTPVGYLCPTCHREAEDAFFNNKPTDYLLAALVALPLSLMAGWLVVRFSGGFFMILILIFAGGAVGGFIARLAKRVINKRRGRFIPHVVAGCVIIGVLVFAWPWLLVLFAGGGGALFKLAGIGIYLFTATSSAFYWAR